ncbi:MAG: pimeloyl-ACP methyl ester carboxylesterase [Arenicella sp.]|jgi:pimeloyl-ACP methyl ester carboxylesterase
MSKCHICSHRFKFVSLAALLITLIVNVDVLAQPYERSEVIDSSISFRSATFAKHKVHYASSGNLDKPGVLFIHGTPGDWGAFENYLQSTQLQRDFFLLSVDRLGWGESPLAPELIDGDFDLQARAIKAVMDQYPTKKWTLVGHSLGASIAPKIALRAPDSVDSLLLLAGSLDPKLGKPRWYNWAASTWAISSLIGNSMTYSNREIMGLRKQLKLMDAELKVTTLDTDLLIIQGDKDKLVSPKNPSYAASEWQSTFNTIEVIQLGDEGHFLPWRQAPLVVRSLYKLRATREQPLRYQYYNKSGKNR